MDFCWWLRTDSKVCIIFVSNSINLAPLKVWRKSPLNWLRGTCSSWFLHSPFVAKNAHRWHPQRTPIPYSQSASDVSSTWSSLPCFDPKAHLYQHLPPQVDMAHFPNLSLFLPQILLPIPPFSLLLFILISSAPLLSLAFYRFYENRLTLPRGKRPQQF